MIVATVSVGWPSSPVDRYRTWLALHGTFRLSSEMLTERVFSTVPGAELASEPEQP